MRLFEKTQPCLGRGDKVCFLVSACVVQRLERSTHNAQKVVQLYPQACMIKKIKGKYVVMSESTGRAFGTYRTMKEAQHRLQQMEFFKHLGKSPAMRKSIRKRSLLK